MYLYFSSEYPAIIKLNGIYFGRIDNAVKSCNFLETDNHFIEVCPLIADQKQLNFILDLNFLSCPPLFVSVTDLKGGYFIKFSKSFFVSEFNVLAQAKFESAVVTVFSENGYKLSIETPCDFYAQTLNMKVDSAEIEQKIVANDTLIFILIKGNVTIATCYKINDKIENLFWREVDSAYFDQTLHTEENLLDMAKHKILCEWNYADNKFSICQKTVQKNQDFNPTLLHERLIPYAFLEEFRVGTEFLDFIDKTVKENANMLSEFFGEFLGVMPPPSFRNINEVGLIYKDSENRYHVEYFTFELENRKIINITKT